MSDNKLVKKSLTQLLLPALPLALAGLEKKVVKENFTNDPSGNVMNYAKFTAVMAGSIALKQYLQNQKFLPD